MLKGQTDPVIFAYWNSRDHTLLGEMIAAWRAHFPEFFVLGDRDILPLVERYFPMYTDLYKKIRLPAAKSDVARLLVLYEFGGVYTDCHMGIRDVDELRRLITCLNNYEAIFLDRIGSFLPRPPGEHFLVNGLIFGQRRSELFMIFARQAFANLAWQQRLEQQYGFVAYTISRLTGPIFTTEMVLQPGSCTRDIRSDFAGRIMIIPEETSPIVRNMYIGYKTFEQPLDRTRAGGTAFRSGLQADVDFGRRALSQLISSRGACREGSDQDGNRRFEKIIRRASGRRHSG